MLWGMIKMIANPASKTSKHHVLILCHARVEEGGWGVRRGGWGGGGLCR